MYATYHYDPVTWNLTDQEDNISHLHYDYDSDTQQLIKVTRSAPIHLQSPQGIHYPTGTQTITYDRYNQPTSLTDLAGNRYTSVHDRLGRVLRARVQLPGQTNASTLTTTTYDLFNRPVTITNGMGITRTFTYNALGQLAATTDQQRRHQVLQQISYTYDQQTGNILTLTRQEDKDSATQTYTYDKNSNSLTAMTCSATGKPGAFSRLCPRDTDTSGSDTSGSKLTRLQLFFLSSIPLISGIISAL